jgi:hypothetical protein
MHDPHVPRLPPSGPNSQTLSPRGQPNKGRLLAPLPIGFREIAKPRLSAFGIGPLRLKEGNLEGD